MACANGKSMEPPFLGYVHTTGDALLLFQAARTSVIPRVTRRLTDTERHSMIKSGSVFIWNEQECRIKRWTDSMTWSPSRIVGNFLVYRETTVRGSGRSPAKRIAMRPRDPNRSSASARQRRPDLSPEEMAQLSHDRSIVGSLADEGVFKPGGLTKRTISLVIDGINHHLISYYNPDDVRANKLATPFSLPRISAVGIPPDLLDRRLGFTQPPRVELVNGVITYAGESADTAPFQRQASPGPSSEVGSSIASTGPEASPSQIVSQLPFFDVFATANGSPYDMLTMPTLRLPQFDLSGEPPFAAESSPAIRNPSRRLSRAYHPYPISSMPRPRRKLSASPEPLTVSSSCGWSSSTSDILPSQPTSFDDSADMDISPLEQSISYGPHPAPASVSDYSHLIDSSFPENFPPFNLDTGSELVYMGPPADGTFSHQYTHPHSPPLTPRLGVPSHRPSLTVDTQLGPRFACSYQPSTVSHQHALVTPPPTARTDSSLSSAQLVWDGDSEERELESGFHELQHDGTLASTHAIDL